MRFLLTIAFLILLMLFYGIPLADGFVKLIGVGSRVEVKSNARNVNMSCGLHNPESILDQTIYCDIDVTRQIKEMKLTFAYYVITRNITAQNALFKRQVDLCFYLRNRKSDRMINLVYQLLMKGGRMPTHCPFGPGPFLFQDFKPSDVTIPPFLPMAEFMLELIYRSELRAEPVVEYRFYGRLVRIFENVLQNSTIVMAV